MLFQYIFLSGPAGFGDLILILIFWILIPIAIVWLLARALVKLVKKKLKK
jgi:hypothetical protein